MDNELLTLNEVCVILNIVYVNKNKRGTNEL